MDYKVYKALKKLDEKDKEESRQESAKLYEKAAYLAVKAGWRLRKHSDIHYSLWESAEGWLLNIYPGNSRLYYDYRKKKGPFLKLNIDWNLLDVIESAIKANGIILKNE